MGNVLTDKISKQKRYYLKNREKCIEDRRSRHAKNKDRENQTSRDWAKNHPHRVWARSSFFGHKIRGCSMNITIDDLEELARSTTECQYCGIPLEFKYGAGFNPVSPTLERIDNEDNLSPDNITIVCRRCNTTKGDRDMRAFVQYCKMIADKFGV